jgi:DNA-directed RNA polymerase subunit M/transcription elongation factor TFIIS
MNSDTLTVTLNCEIVSTNDFYEKFILSLEDKEWIKKYNSSNYEPDEHYISFKEKENRYLSIIENPIQIEEGIYECRKCKSKKTFSYQLQTRSADEGMTTFVECSKCSVKWRIY